MTRAEICGDQNETEVAVARRVMWKRRSCHRWWSEMGWGVFFFFCSPISIQLLSPAVKRNKRTRAHTCTSQHKHAWSPQTHERSGKMEPRKRLLNGCWMWANMGSKCRETGGPTHSTTKHTIFRWLSPINVWSSAMVAVLILFGDRVDPPSWAFP